MGRLPAPTSSCSRDSGRAQADVYLQPFSSGNLRQAAPDMPSFHSAVAHRPTPPMYHFSACGSSNAAEGTRQTRSRGLSLSGVLLERMIHPHASPQACQSVRPVTSLTRLRPDSTWDNTAGLSCSFLGTQVIECRGGGPTDSFEWFVSQWRYFGTYDTPSTPACQSVRPVTSLARLRPDSAVPQRPTRQVSRASRCVLHQVLRKRFGMLAWVACLCLP